MTEENGRIEKMIAAHKEVASLGNVLSTAWNSHRERIHAEIADDLIESGAILARNDALNVAKAIAAWRIRHLTINY